MDETGLNSWILKKAHLNVIIVQQCNKILQEQTNTLLREHQICAGHKNLTQGVCFGNSGGPLFVRGRVADVLSTTILHPCKETHKNKNSNRAKPLCGECEYPFFPSMYTTIQGYRHWIDRTIKTMILYLHLEDKWDS